MGPSDEKAQAAKSTAAPTPLNYRSPRGETRESLQQTLRQLRQVRKWMWIILGLIAIFAAIFVLLLVKHMRHIGPWPDY